MNWEGGHMPFRLEYTKRVTLTIGLLMACALSGCGSVGSTNSHEPGSIAGIVSVDADSAQPTGPAGWSVVVVENEKLRASVASSGAYMISGVPAGKYRVRLLVPEQAGYLPSCSVPECQHPSVTVLAGLSTVNVDFAVDMVPAPPF